MYISGFGEMSFGEEQI